MVILHVDVLSPNTQHSPIARACDCDLSSNFGSLPSRLGVYTTLICISEKHVVPELASAARVLDTITSPQILGLDDDHPDPAPAVTSDPESPHPESSLPESSHPESSHPESSHPEVSITTPNRSRSADSLPDPSPSTADGTPPVPSHFTHSSVPLGTDPEPTDRPAVNSTVPSSSTPGGPDMRSWTVHEGLDGTTSVPSHTTSSSAPVDTNPELTERSAVNNTAPSSLNSDGPDMAMSTPPPPPPRSASTPPAPALGLWGFGPPALHNAGRSGTTLTSDQTGPTQDHAVTRPEPPTAARNGRTSTVGGGGGAV